MSWLLIGVILLAAFGPVMWLLPSKRDRHLTALRQQARLEGLVVELRQLPILHPSAEERVSAGAKQRNPVVECAAYSYRLPRRLKLVDGWRLRRDQPGTVAPGWVGDPALTDPRAALAEVSQWLGDWLAALPDDAIALELRPVSVDVYWLEKSSHDVQSVTSIAAQLLAIGGEFAALDVRKIAELTDEDS